MDDTRSRNSWLEWLILGSCAVFIFILALSAVYDRSIRVLHVFQALIYVAVVILARRRSAWGYGAGCIIPAFWNWTDIAHTTFIANGFRELGQALQTGRLNGPERAGQRPANGFGLHDVSENVHEWCADWFDEHYYSNSPSRNPPRSCEWNASILARRILEASDQDNPRRGSQQHPAPIQVQRLRVPLRNEPVRGALR